jgi:hypothetical protein
MSTYPKYGIDAEGRVPELLRRYPNLWFDTSAGSGYNAFARDEEYAVKFLNEFQDRALFGTDVCYATQKIENGEILKRFHREGRLSDETFEKIIACIRDIIDSVKPERAFYCIEPMPWMVPDSPEAYVQLIRDVDRKQFGAHMDFVNMINCPRRYLDAEGFINECFRTLAPYIKSTHLKDTRMHPTRLTTILEECSPGEGKLNFRNVLTIMNRYLPADAPVLLEHMQTFEEYEKAYAYVAAEAKEAHISI